MNRLEEYYAVFEEELAEDIRFERAISRRCLYSVAVVVAVVVARSIWLV